MFLKVFIFLLMSSQVATAVEQSASNIMVQRVKDDDIAKDILYEQVSREEEKISRNKALLNELELTLSNAMQRGLIEKEKCIRQNISALRTINYVYNWMLNQAGLMEHDTIRLSTVESLDRMKYLNKRFMDTNYRIDSCCLNNVKSSIARSNEITRYSVDRKFTISVPKLPVTEEFDAARSPFR